MTHPMSHRTIGPAIIFLALGMVARLGAACQCERYSTCNEVAATNLVFIGTVESIEPMFLNRWNDTSQSSLKSLNDAFIRAQQQPSAEALAALKDVYLKTFPDISEDRKSKVQTARTVSGVAALFYSSMGRGMKVRFRVQTLFKHEDDDDDSPKPSAKASKNGKGGDKDADDDKGKNKQTKKNPNADDDDDDRKAPISAKKQTPPGRATLAKKSEKPAEKEADDFLEVWTPFGECGISFQTGETYLVFATDDEETSDSMTTDSCSRTRRLSEAGEDLAYLYFYKEHPEESTRIDGYATTNSRYRLDFSPLHPEKIQPVIRNVVIELKSTDLRRFTETDQNGHFVFDGLPAGDYTLAAYDSDYPKGKQLSADPLPVHLQSKSCSLQILVLSKDAPGGAPK